MGIRWTIGNGTNNVRGNARNEQSEHYTDGYNAGYGNAMTEMRAYNQGMNDAMNEMRNEMRGYAEARRGRARGEMEEHAAPLQPGRIGFTGNYDNRGQGNSDMVMSMLEELKQGQDSIKQGMAQSKKTLDPHMDGLLESAMQVLANPPQTWVQHLHQKDYAGIAKMEGKELMQALEAHKPMHEIRKELTHTIAALFQMVSAQ